MAIDRRELLRWTLYMGTAVGVSVVAPNVLKVTQAASLMAEQFADNTLIREQGQTRVYVVIGGAALYVSDPAQLAPYGGVAALLTVPVGTVSTLKRIPQDNTLIREYQQTRVYVVIGGAALYVPDAAQLTPYGGATAIRAVPTGTLNMLTRIPQENTLIREQGQIRVYVVKNQAKLFIANPADLVPYGGAGAIRDVPSGTLARIPDAPSTQVVPPRIPPTRVPPTPIPPPPQPTPAQVSHVVRLELNLFCEEQNENGDDEIYITSSEAWSPGPGPWNPWSGLIWWGDMSDSDDDKHWTGKLYLDDYPFAPGDVVTIAINVLEQDGQNYEPGTRLAVELAKEIGGAVAGATGAGEVASAVGAIDVEAIFTRLRATGVFKNTDDYIGTFIIIGECNQRSEMRWSIYPKARSRRLSDGRLRLDGDGAEYYPHVYANGVQLV